MSTEDIKPTELTPPPIALEPGATEVLRVWVAPGHEQQVSFKTTWEDPGVWGTLLAGIVRHAAGAYEKQGLDPQEVFERIYSIFEAEFIPAVDVDAKSSDPIEPVIDADTDAASRPH